MRPTRAPPGRTRDELIGRPVFDAFPDNPLDSDANGVANLRASLKRALDTGCPHAMGVQKYDIPDGRGGFIERWWSPVNVPILDESGTVRWRLHRVQDVTDLVHERDARQAALDRGLASERRADIVEDDLYARAKDLAVALTERDTTARRLAALAEVALRLAAVDTTQELADVVFGEGLPVLGAQGGTIAVRAPGSDVLTVTVAGSLGPGSPPTYGELPLSGPLPISMAARGTVVLLPDPQVAAAYAGAAEALRLTGTQAWAMLPLRVGHRIVGSLSVGWAQPHPFPAQEVELLKAFAAQCAIALDRLQTRAAERQAAAEVERMSETLQRSLLTQAAQPKDLQIAVRYRPAAQEAQIGGDWYDALVTSAGATCLVIGDVAGHDRDAAAQMGQVRNLLRGIAYTTARSPAETLTTLDLAMRDLQVGGLATAVLALVEKTDAGSEGATHVLHWSNAGHPPPLLIHADGTAETLGTKADLLLGLDPATARADHVRPLAPGTTVVLYTDGLIERRGATIDDGFAWLRGTAAGLPALEPEALCAALLERLPANVEDDIALLALRV